MGESSTPRPTPAGRPDPVFERVAATEPVLRRVIAARVADAALVDDLVQDALERLLGAAERIDPDRLVPYAIVTAQHLVVSDARRRREVADDVAEVIDLSEGPAAAVLAGEDSRHLVAALAAIPEPERGWVVAHDGFGVPADSLDTAGVEPAAVRARLSRARVRLRVEYVLLERTAALPTAQCKTALIAVAGSDHRRRLTARAHVDSCPACRALAPELTRRRPVLALVPLLGLRRLLRVPRAHLRVTAGAVSTAAGMAAIVASAVHVSDPPPLRAAAGATAATGVRTTPPAPTPRSAAPPAPDPTRTGGELLVAGVPTRAGGSLVASIGRPVVARDLVVVGVPAHNGFWVADRSGGELFVEMVGPLRPLRVRLGDRVSFTGPVVGNGPDFAAAVGVSPAEGAALLAAKGAHVAPSTTTVVVTS